MPLSTLFGLLEIVLRRSSKRRRHHHLRHLQLHRHLPLVLPLRRRLVIMSQHQLELTYRLLPLHLRGGVQMRPTKMILVRQKTKTLRVVVAAHQAATAMQGVMEQNQVRARKAVTGALRRPGVAM